LAYYIRAMTRQDLADVTEIDREAFPTQWPPADYGYEFKNHMAHYVVACDPGTKVKQQPERPGGLSRLFARLSGRAMPAPEPPAASDYIVGFAGFWVMAGEAHVTSIAVRQSHRGKGLGALLLRATIDMAMKLEADLMTLEVRLSNSVAQNLYLKYGFKRVGERRNYYLDRGPKGDTREDAIIMTTDSIKSPEYQELLRLVKNEQAMGELERPRP
jgi:[ribosomal protein S18]-alanine N-acetyltransferase